MTDDTQEKQAHFERVAGTFSRARRVVPAQREAFLDVECGDDDALRSEVRKLLDAHDDAPVQPLAMAPGVPGFRILRRIGVGGMGTVYEAEQDHPRRRVALKVLRLDALSDESLARFETEARALARLQHPGIARIFEAGRFEGPAGSMPYLAMELIDGPSIRDAASHLDRDARISLLIEVCAAVEHAHQRGILHRDLKPANILVADDGRPRVLDFGVAREIEEPSPHTRTGHLLGTLAYMSPEQARGEFDDLDTRCDIYALGVIGYELVSGQVPHSVQSLPLLEAARVVANEPHRSLGRDDLAVVLDKALAKDREFRYPSATALADDLRRVLNREPVRARPPSRVYYVRRFVQRNRSMVAFVALVVVALTVLWFRALDSAAMARTQRSVAARARYAAQVQAATSYLDLADIDAARSVLSETESSQRGWMWDHLSAVTNSDLESRAFDAEPWLVHPFQSSRPRYWCDGQVHDADGPMNYGFARGMQRPVRAPDDNIVGMGNNRFFVLREGEPARHLFRGLPEDSDIDFCNTHDRVVAMSVFDLRGRVSVYDTKTRRPLWIKDTTRLKFARFSADGKHVIGATFWNGELLMWNAADGTLIRRWNGHTDHITLLVVSPASGHFATFAMDWRIRIWNQNGALVASLDDPGQFVHGLKFSPDGSLLVSAHPRGTVRLWDVKTGMPYGAAAGESWDHVRDVAWSDDGQEVHCVAGNSVYLRGARSRTVRRVVKHHAPLSKDKIHPYIYDVAYSPDGRWLASVGWDQTARVCNAKTGELVRTLAIPKYVYACAFDADNVLYVTTDWDGVAQAWDITTGKVIAERKISAKSMSVHPNGKELAVGGIAGVHFFAPKTLRDLAPERKMNAAVDACAYSPTGNFLAAGDTEGFVTILRDRKIVRRWRAQAAILSVAWSPDETRVAVGTKTGQVTEYDAKTGQRVDGLQIPESRVFSLVYSPDGRLLFIGSDEHSIRVWDTVGGDGLGRLRGHRAYVKGMAMSPDGTTLASASGDNTVRLWHRTLEGTK